ncbi:hypothetical protein ACSBR2_013165 [Camellia fascicularis]
MNSSLLCQTNVKGDTALHLAAREGQQDPVDALIQCAKKLDAEGSVKLESDSTMTQKMLRTANEVGDTALHDDVRLHSHRIKLHRFKIFFVLVPKPNSIRLLTEEDPKYTYRANNAGETPLYIAAERRHEQVVSQILKTCRAPAYGGPGGRTALHAAVISNNEGPSHLGGHDSGGGSRRSRWWWRRWYWASVGCCGGGDDVMEVAKNNLIDNTKELDITSIKLKDFRMSEMENKECRILKIRNVSTNSSTQAQFELDSRQNTHSLTKTRERMKLQLK